jgi:serine/threonine protein kinase
MNVVSLCAGFIVDLDDDAAVAKLLEREILPTEVADAVRQADAVHILADRYEVGDVIGRGATSTVCRGRDRQFNCPVAIKLLDPPGDKAGEAALRAAIGEARMVRRINSPHVVRVHDAGIDGVAYIVMDLEMEKDNAAEYAAAALSSEAYQPRSFKEAMQWVRDAALGASAAHRLAVYHYDIKPLNLLVEPVSRRAKLIDFGVSATARGVGGTPAYMAPEHARAIIERVSFKMLDCSKLDIFGLGALAYHLIFGEPLCTPIGDITTQLAAAADAYPTVPPHKYTAWGRCPRRAAAILRRALARDPADRYASAAEMAADIESWLAGFPLQCEQQRPLTRFKLWCARARRSLAALAVAFVGILVLAIVSIRLWDDITEASAQLDDLGRQVASTEQELVAKNVELDTLNQKLAAKSKELAESYSMNQRLNHDVAVLWQELALNVDGNRQREEFADKLSERNKEITIELERSGRELLATRGQLSSAKHDLTRTVRQLEVRTGELAKSQAAVATAQGSLDATRADLASARMDLTRANSELARAKSDLAMTKQALASTQHENFRQRQLIRSMSIGCNRPSHVVAAAPRA